jgi:hypothetical protein
MRPRHTGISAQVLPEYAPASFRNPCPSVSGIGAQVVPEYALCMRRAIVIGKIGAS